MRRGRGSRIWMAFLASAAVPAGLAAKAYAGPGGAWVRDSLAGSVYEAFWVWLVLAAFPSVRPPTAGWAVFAATCALEAAQTWHPPFLEAARATFVGRALLGNSFAWLDIPHYAAGCLLAVFAAAAFDARAARGGGTPPRRPE